MIGCKCNALHVAFNFYLPLSPPSGSVRFRGSFASALLHLFPPSTPPRTLSCLLETCLFNFFATNCVSWLSYSNGVRVHYAFSLCHPHIICSRPLAVLLRSFVPSVSFFIFYSSSGSPICPSMSVLHSIRSRSSSFRSSFFILSFILHENSSVSLCYVRSSICPFVNLSTFACLPVLPHCCPFLFPPTTPSFPLSVHSMYVW